MNRAVVQERIVAILIDDFEFEQPGLDDNLRDEHGFDSVDAIELLAKIEQILGFGLTRDEKENAMGVRTVNELLDYLEALVAARND